MSLEDLRVGIVGLGNIANMHASYVEDVGAEVVAGLDVDPEARDRFEAEYGATTYEEIDDLLEVVDAVFVTTPNRFHEDYAVAALEAGVPLFLEKPLAHSMESAQRIADVAAETDTTAMVGLHNRFSGGTEVVAAMRENGRLGDISHVEAEYVRRRGIPALGSWFTSEDLAGGGALIDIGVHLIDYALYLADFPEIVEVSGRTRSEFGDREDYTDVRSWGVATEGGEFSVDDSASAFVRAADGTTFSLEVSWATNREPGRDVIVRGTEAGAKLPLGGGEATLYDASVEGVDHFETSEIETNADDAHEICDVEFLEAVAAGEEPEGATIEEALTVQRVIDGIYRSSEEGRAIRLDD